MASTAPAVGRFEIGGVVRRMVSGISANWQTLLVVALVTGAISAAFTTLSMSQVMGLLDAANPTAMLSMFTSPVYWLTMFGSMSVGTFSMGTMLGVLVRTETGAAKIGSAFAVGLRCFLPMIALTILWILGLLVGYILLIVPAIILATMWSVAAPALVAERLNPVAAFGRSRALTKGIRWPVFGALLLFVIVYFVIAYGVQGFSSTGMLSLYKSNVMAAMVIGMFSSSVLSILTSAFLAGLYGEVLESKEGGSHSQLAEVFA